MVEFSLALEDGTNVRVVFEYFSPGLPHFNFYGNISETGYRSHFPIVESGIIEESEIKLMAREFAEEIRAEFLTETQRKIKRLCHGKMR